MNIDRIRNEVVARIHSQVSITPWMRSTREIWNKVTLGMIAKIDIRNQVQEQTSDSQNFKK